MARQTALPPNLAPRFVSRVAAAAYLNVSATKFDELVDDGRMPRARRIDGRKVWDLREIDPAADKLPRDGDDDDDQDDTWDD